MITETLTLGDLIATLRRSKRVRQADLAKAVGISVSYLSLIENGTKPPSKKILKGIATYFNLSIAELFLEAVSESFEEKKKFYESRDIIEKIVNLILS